jgi:phthalate 4,5-dioxygenase
MLNKTDNELVTRVGRGTPMGNLMRQFWLPVLLDWELEADGEPLRVRLLGEDLIAFRRTDGRVGMIQDACMHRGASLFFGRNEENGLRCVYHGWKYDVTGQCVDMPNEPAESNFKAKIKATAYPCVESGGVIWTYMGPEDPAPPLPDLEWMGVPAENRWISKRTQDSNWLQAIEGEIDQSHVSFVHAALKPEDMTPPSVGGPRNNIAVIRANDKSPHFEIAPTEYGVCIGAGRDAGDDQAYWRVTQWLEPFHIMTGPYGPNPTRNWRAWVPIDDENVFVIGCSFHPLRAFTEEERARQGTRSGVWHIAPETRAPKTSQPFGAWRGIASMENDFNQDREMQKTKTVAGIPEFWAQDAAMQISMGRIFDRTKEHLGTTDLGIVSVRRRLLNDVKQLAEFGTQPAPASHPEWYQVRSDAVIIPKGENWLEATTERRKVKVGVNPDAA